VLRRDDIKGSHYSLNHICFKPPLNSFSKGATSMMWYITHEILQGKWKWNPLGLFGDFHG
jgi:hypothetical protein